MDPPLQLGMQASSKRAGGGDTPSYDQAALHTALHSPSHGLRRSAVQMLASHTHLVGQRVLLVQQHAAALLLVHSHHMSVQHMGYILHMLICLTPAPCRAAHTSQRYIILHTTW
jgi:hypothetical protein